VKNKFVNTAVIEITEDLEAMYHSHVKYIAKHLRRSDYNELGAISQRPPSESVMLCAKGATRKWIIIRSVPVYREDKSKHVHRTINIPVGLFGVTEMVDRDSGERFGAPWMIATEGMKKVRKFMIKNSDKYIDIMVNDYGKLVNYVDARNEPSITWLKRCGFTFEVAEPLGHKQVPFHKFYKGVA